MNPMLTGLEMHEGSLCDWWDLGDDEAARVFDVLLDNLHTLADAGHIPQPGLVVWDDGLLDTKFSGEAIDKRAADRARARKKNNQKEKQWS